MRLTTVLLVLLVSTISASAVDATCPLSGARPAESLPTDDSLWIVVDSLYIGPPAGFNRGLKVDPSGAFLWRLVGQLPNYRVEKWDIASGALADSFPSTAPAGDGLGVVRFGDSICVAVFSVGRFDIYDTLGNYARSFNSPVAGGARGVDWDGNKFWSSTTTTIYTMDRTGNLLRTLTNVGSPPVANMHDFCLDKQAPYRLWVSSFSPAQTYYCSFDTSANTFSGLAGFTHPAPAGTPAGIGFWQDPGGEGYIWTMSNTWSYAWKIQVHASSLPPQVSMDSLYFKNYGVTNVVYGSPKTEVPNPVPVNCRPPFTFMDYQSRVGMDPDGRYIYEVSTTTTLRRHQQSDGTYQDFALAHAGNTSVRTDGSFLFVPVGSQVYKYDMTGNWVNTTTISITPVPYDFSIARDTVWCGAASGTEYGYACSRFTGGSITEDATWNVGAGTGDPAFVAWDGTYFCVAWSGYASNTFKVFDANRALLSEGTVALDPRGLMCRVGPPVAVEEPTAPEQSSVLLRVWPNPSRGTTHVSYSLPVAGKATLRLYDATGALVQDFGTEQVHAGSRVLTVNGTRLARGVYLLRLETGSGSVGHKLVLQ